MRELKNIVLLIDADNTQLSRLEDVIRTVSDYGRIVVKRAYGNWKKESLKNWEPTLNRLAIKAEQQFDYVTGKNATDIALVIDAVTLMHRNLYDAFVIVASDSDYTPLAIHLREAGLAVIGIGEKNTPSSVRNSCDLFLSLDQIAHLPSGSDYQANIELSFAVEDLPAYAPKPIAAPEEKPSAARVPVVAVRKTAEAPAPEHRAEPLPQKKKAEKLEPTKKKVEKTEKALKAEKPVDPPAKKKGKKPEKEDGAKKLESAHKLLRIVAEKYREPDGYVSLSSAGNYIRQEQPDFSIKQYGYSTLSKFLKAFPEKYKVVEVPDQGCVAYKCRKK